MQAPPPETPARERRGLLSRLGELVRVGLTVAAVFAFCWVANRYRLSPRPDLTPAEALTLSGVRLACQSETDPSRLAVFREPKDPLQFMGQGSAAAYVFDLRSDRLTDWSVDTFRDEPFERRQQLFKSGWRHMNRDEALRLLESRRQGNN
jgi:hypothetical protein